jgi:hypothetical protein
MHPSVDCKLARKQSGRNRLSVVKKHRKSISGCKKRSIFHFRRFLARRNEKLAVLKNFYNVIPERSFRNTQSVLKTKLNFGLNAKHRDLKPGAKNTPGIDSRVQKAVSFSIPVFFRARDCKSSCFKKELKVVVETGLQKGIAGTTSSQYPCK